ncbi:MAG: histidine kinase [Chitinophagaceae bacterium]
MKKSICTGLLLLSMLCRGQQTRAFRLLDNELLRTADVLKVQVDPSGLAWILTNKGFMSFDGTELRSFKDTLSGSYTNSLVGQVPDICSDRKGNLYAWKYETGVICFNTKNGRYTVCGVRGTDSTVFRNSVVTDMFIDRDNICWLASRSGLIRYSYKDQQVRFMFLSDQNLEYLSAEGHDSNKEQPFYNTVKKMFTSIAPDVMDPGKLWVSGGNTVWHFEKSTGKFSAAVLPEPGNPQKYGYLVMDLLDINADTLVFATMGGGLGFYSKKEQHYHFVLRDSSTYLKSGIQTNKNIATGLSENKDGFFVSYRDALPAFFDTGKRRQEYITGDSLFKGFRIVTDNQQRVWIFTRSRLYYSQAKPLSFQTIDVAFQEQVKNGANLLSSIYWDQEESKYYAGVNFSDGVFLWNRDFSRATVYPARNPPALALLESVIWDITKVNGVSWAIGMGNHLIVMHKGLYQSFKQVTAYNKFTIPYTEPEREALDLLKKNEQELFVLGGKGEVYKINSKDLSAEKIASFRDSAGSSAWGLGKMMKGTNEHELFITDYKTIYKLDLVTKQAVSFLPVFKAAPVAMNFVDIATDQRGDLWIASRDNELVCYSGHDFKLLDRLPGKLNFGTYSNIVVTQENILLAGESNGLVVYDINRKKLWRYNERSGLPAKGFNKILYENGFVFLSYEDQVLAILLKELLREPATPLVYLSGLAVYGKDIITDSLLNWQHTIHLDYHQDFITLRVSSLNYDNPDQVKYEYRVPELDTGWIEADYFNRGISFAQLRPSTYSFQVKASLPNGVSGPVTGYKIIITPAWWQTNLFKVCMVLLAIAAITVLLFLRIRFVRRTEQKKLLREKEMLELEARALRAQMNPHFIFNCLNSIKSLIQQHEEEKSVTYLTTFSKLIRTLFNNADKKAISLYDEIETCRLYLQLESMRFDAKFSYSVNVHPDIDLKSILVPALIIQPFIENAIWHGIVPRNTGGKVSLDVIKKEKDIQVIIEDNGIGREAAENNKPDRGLAHHSKGVNLTQSRLELDNLLRQREARLESFDLKDETGKAAGTRVIITIKEEV